MRMRNDYYTGPAKVDLKNVRLSVIQGGAAARPEFNTSFEKEIEHLLFESRRLGWSYNEFVTHLMEILTVLQLRDKIKLAPSPADKA
jgi:hypothetical protein